jgi:thiamine-phosphate diphosphorylase/hydroxyethylthiazole kinase
MTGRCIVSRSFSHSDDHFIRTGTALTVFCGAARHLPSPSPSQLITGDPLLGVLAGLLVYTIAGEKAGVRADVKGPNTFRSAFIDEMYNLKEEDVRKLARFEVFAR